MKALVLLFLLFAGFNPGAFAHEVRPAYLELREVAAGEFDVLWKTPMRGELRLALEPSFSGTTQALTPVVSRQTGGASVQTWKLRADEPLRGQTLRIAGLDSTITDALARIQFADGTTWIRRLSPQAPAARITLRQGGLEVSGEYLRLGVEHILTGIDHLLFVLALLLVTRGRGRLMAAISAFTLAHSITLGLATLGMVHLPPAPIEAVIALSIVFMAAEFARRPSGVASLTQRAPWIVAFVFGLLHGFGFAGALAEVGLPETDIPLALVAFNVGVEIGQLLFVAVVLLVLTLGRRLAARHPIERFRRHELARPALAYLIGGVAMFWTIERFAAL